jgi:hypothetical protein
MTKLRASIAVVLFSLGLATTAWASCDIFNDTGHDFTVESGNTSNQSVGAHTHTTIAGGKVIAKSKDGKSFGGMCKDGDHAVVTEKDGVVVMELK